MPTQEVAGGASTALLLGSRERSPGSVLLDGGGSDSWGDGSALYSHSPSRTLEIYASGWGRWCVDGRVDWRLGPPLSQWRDFLRTTGSTLRGGGDPQATGTLTVLNYELKHWIERLPRRHPWPDDAILYSAFYDWHYAANHRTGKACVRALSRRDLDRRVQQLEASVAHDDQSRASGCLPIPCPRPAMEKSQYLQMIARAQEYIAAGDIYQVNLAQSFCVDRPAIDAARLFAAWSGKYPAPFASYVDAGSWKIVSNSPECFLLVNGRQVATFPIKGTRRAGADHEAATRAAEALAADPKEGAEHVMIVDLVRNDLGRVCESGSVEVSRFATVRAYPLLLHMESEVRGTLRSQVSLPDLIRATFPGGSVTGAPKVRAMQIIEELEPSPRGFYTGAIGWTDWRGDSRFSLPIRSAVVTRAGLTYHAGGAIVADSDPEREYDESLLKSETLFRSLADLR